MFRMLHVKIFIVAVITSQAILCVRAVDEFAEFDDIGLGDSVDISSNDGHVKQSDISQQDNAIKLSGESTSRDSVKSNSRDEKQSVNRVKDKADEFVVHSDKGSKNPDLKLVSVPSVRQFRIENYSVELLILLVALAYLANFFVGGAKNAEFAQGWFDLSKDLLKQQFSLVGGVPTIENNAQKRGEEAETALAALKKQRGLIKSSESLFTVWNSGRVGMEGLLVEINLLKRQDLFSMALNLLKASKDNLVLRFSLGAETYENFVFCIAHRTQAARLARDMVDINTFCPKRKPLSQCGFDIEKLVLMSELSDVTSSVLEQKTVNFLQKYEKQINYIHITDRYSSDKSEEIAPLQKLAQQRRMATFSFSFPRNAEERTDFILFPLFLLDRLRRFKLARDSRQKSDKNRQKITDYIQKTAFSLRQEAAQAKKEEQRRLEKERIYNEDDPEKQRRWEKKEAKREQKRNKLRVKQLKVSK